MGRYDRDNVDHLDLPDPVTTTATYYTTDGSTIDRTAYEQLEQKPRIVSKCVVHPETRTASYFVLVGDNNRMYDPREKSDGYQRRNVWKFRRVKKAAFDLYNKFLTAKYSSLLTQAERAL